MKFLFNEKVINQGYLHRIEADLQWRISVSKGELVSDETLEERMEVINNHRLLLDKVVCFIEELWEQNIELFKNEKERQQRTEQLQSRDI